MSAFPNAPRLIKGGLVLIDPASGVVQRTLSFQYNPDTLTRSLQPKAASPEGGDRSEALRLKGPPVETIKLEAEFDATDLLEAGDPAAAAAGLQADLAALETLLYPASGDLLNGNALARSGTLEIAPMQGPLALFVWSEHRVVPVRVTDLGITEEAFDPKLNPIRAKVSLGLRVLSVDDLGFDARGGALFLIHQQQKEQLAHRARGASLSTLGLKGIP